MLFIYGGSNGQDSSSLGTKMLVFMTHWV
jgi:hypothetical protein